MIVKNLVMALDQDYLGVPDQAESHWLVEELRCYEAVKQPSGAIRYGAPEGRHDDGVTALMLAAHGLQGEWRTLTREEVLPSVWWQRDDPWEWLRYEHEVAAFRRRFPDKMPPVHPTDLAWTLLESRN